MRVFQLANGAGRHPLRTDGPGRHGVLAPHQRATGAARTQGYAREDERTGDIRLLGGNQDNAVLMVWRARDRVVATRWPATIAPRPGGRLLAAIDAPLDLREAQRGG